MKFTRLQLAMVLTGAVVICACWAVGAQEGRPLWSPTVLHADEMPKSPTKAATKPPLRLAPPAKKGKADATLIIPPEVYEVPQAVERARAGFVTSDDLILTGGVTDPPIVKDVGVPPPLPAPPQLEEKKPVIAAPPAPLPPPLPSIEPKAPPPLPEPTKALIADSLHKDMPQLVPSKSGMAEQLAPAPSLEPKKESRGIPPPVVKPDFSIPPPTLESKKEPTIAAPPVTMPELKKEFSPAPTFVEPRKEPVVPSVPQIKSFVPVGMNPPTVPMPMQPPTSLHEGSRPPFNPDPVPIGPSVSMPESRDGRIVTPMIAVEKRGQSQLTAGETQTYQIIVRNIGNIPARQIRIEDEIAPEVRAIAAEPLPQVQGAKAIWTLPSLAPGAEQTLRISLQAISAVQLSAGTSVHVSAASNGSEPTLVMRPRNPVDTIAVQLISPTSVNIGKPAVFDVRVTNLATQPFTGMTLRGFLGEGFTSPEGNEIVGKIDITMQPGESRTLKMPATAVKAGRHTVSVKVTPSAGLEVAASVNVEVAGRETVRIQTAPVTKLLIGRDGDIRIDITNRSGQAMRNVDIACRLPDGLGFVIASERGLYQANSRTVFWHVENLPTEKTLTLQMKLHGDKAGQFTHAIFVRADGVPEIKASGTVSVEGVADLTLRVIDRDNPLELGKDTVYEIQVVNPGTSPARDVQIRVEFPPGMQPRQAQGNMKYSVDGQTVTFEPIPSLPTQEQLVFRVSATARSAGDQRVRFAVVSDQVRTPVQREISTLVYRD